MLAALGQVGKALIPQLITIGGRAIGNSSLGDKFKRFMSGSGGQVVKGLTNNILGDTQGG